MVIRVIIDLPISLSHPVHLLSLPGINGWNLQMAAHLANAGGTRDVTQLSLHVDGELEELC